MTSNIPYCHEIRTTNALDHVIEIYFKKIYKKHSAEIPKILLLMTAAAYTQARTDPFFGHYYKLVLAHRNTLHPLTESFR